MVGFFFQAEDGIRDGHVAGVQTCALPISSTLTPTRGSSGRTADAGSTSGAYWTRGRGAPRRRSRSTHEAGTSQIGRASCRERVQTGVVAGPRSTDEEPLGQDRDEHHY